MRWWQGAEVFQEGYGIEDGITTMPGFQDTLDDILPPGEECDLEHFQPLHKLFQNVFTVGLPVGLLGHIIRLAVPVLVNSRVIAKCPWMTTEITTISRSTAISTISVLLFTCLLLQPCQPCISCTYSFVDGPWLCAIHPNDRRCSAPPPCTPAAPAATGRVLVSVRNRPFPSHPRTCPLLQPCQPCLPSTLRAPSLALGRVRFTGTFNGASHVAVRLVMKVLPLAYCNKVSFFSFFFSFSPPPT